MHISSGGQGERFPFVGVLALALLNRFQGSTHMAMEPITFVDVLLTFMLRQFDMNAFKVKKTLLECLH